RHDEQRDTLGTFRSTRQTGQYDVDDVIGHVVFTGRDEDFAASNGIRTVSVRLGFGFQDTQVRTAMGFGQTHGTGPLTRHQLAQVDVFLFVSTVQFDGVHRAVGQTRVHTPGPVGRTHHFRHHNAQRFRPTLTTVVYFMSQLRSAAFYELLVRFFKTGRSCFRTILMTGTAFDVTHAVQRR